MNQKSAKGIRGSILFDSRPDGKPVLRVYGEPDPSTGTKPFTDYLLCVSDLNVEVTSGYFVLLDPEPGEPGEPRVDYRKQGEVLAAETTLTLRQAADFLDVSCSHMAKLFDAGEIPSHVEGDHRHVALCDLLAFKVKLDAERDAALAELARLTQELGD